MNKFNISVVEREFILKAISERKRLDSREAFQFRDIAIQFGMERGCCIVDLGRTKVMAQVSSEVSAPKESRPTEGILFINVELSSMAAPYFDSSRPSDASAEVNRLLERCLKESGCVDLESLCIQAGMKVWVIRIDLHVLNNDGNIVDALCVAAVSALNHFRRPDISVCGEDVAILSVEEKDPLPLTLHHMPLCVTFAFFDQGRYILIDPTEIEEHVMDGTLVICMNRHKEVCVVQSTGNASLLKEQISRCKEICYSVVCTFTEQIILELQKDKGMRTVGSRTDVAASGDEGKVNRKAGKPAKSTKPVKQSKAVESAAVVVETETEEEKTRVEMIAATTWDSDLDEDLEILTKFEEVTTLSKSAYLETAEDSVSPRKSKKKKKKAKSAKHD